MGQPDGERVRKRQRAPNANLYTTSIFWFWIQDKGSLSLWGFKTLRLGKRAGRDLWSYKEHGKSGFINLMPCIANEVRPEASRYFPVFSENKLKGTWFYFHLKPLRNRSIYKASIMHEAL